MLSMDQSRIGSYCRNVTGKRLCLFFWWSQWTLNEVTSAEETGFNGTLNPEGARLSYVLIINYSYFGINESIMSTLKWIYFLMTANFTFVWNLKWWATLRTAAFLTPLASPSGRIHRNDGICEEDLQCEPESEAHIGDSLGTHQVKFMFNAGSSKRIYCRSSMLS